MMSSPRKPVAALVALSLGLLFAEVVHAEPDAVAETRDDDEATDSAARVTIVIGGDDADLIEAVAAELRAAGFDVVVVGPDPKASKDGVSVSVERVGESVMVHATRPDGELDAEILEPDEGDGMTSRDATALRTAEAIRSLVTVPRSTIDGEAVEEQPEPEALSEPLPDPGASPPRRDRPPRATAPAAVTQAEVGDGIETVEMPVLRGALFTGAGILSPAPSMVVGLSVRGQLSRYFNVAGMLMASKNIGDAHIEDGLYDIYGVRGGLLASWEILGADHVWTPSIGGGVIGDFRYWEGQGHFVDGRGQPLLTTLTPVYEGSMLGAGLAATAGVSVARPWRFRFDVHADVRMVTWDVFGNGHDQMAPTLAPSILGTMGIEYDFVRRPVVRQDTARR